MAAMLVAVTVVGGAPMDGAKIDAKADQQLKAMSKYLAGMQTFSFQVEEFFDDVQEDGQKLQYSNQRKLTVSRPGKLAGEADGDTAHSQFFFDGTSVTVYDRQNKTYAVAKVSGTIESMLEQMHEKYGSHTPMSDFLFPNPYKILTENVESGTYVGLNHVGKTKCHHLAFRQKLLDWQIWIDAGENPVPRKLVITFKRRAGEPQFTALIHKWDVNPKVAEETFQFTPPEGVRKVEWLQRHGEPQPEKKGAPK
jgi:hypothetical protein